MNTSTITTETSNSKPETKKMRDARWIARGYATLLDQLQQAEAMGGLYALVPHVSKSGLRRRVVLMYGNPNFRAGVKGADPMVQVFPSLHTDLEIEVERAGNVPGGSNMSWQARHELRKEMHEVIAKSWGYDYKARSFIVDGAGMDMIWHLIDSLAHKCGIDEPLAETVERGTGRRPIYANRVGYQMLWSE